MDWTAGTKYKETVNEYHEERSKQKGCISAYFSEESHFPNLIVKCVNLQQFTLFFKLRYLVEKPIHVFDGPIVSVTYVFVLTLKYHSIPKCLCRHYVVVSKNVVLLNYCRLCAAEHVFDPKVPIQKIFACPNLLN